MEIQLSHCGRMCLGLPEVELRGLLRHATRRRTAARHMEAATHTLWAQVPLCFSLLIAPPHAVAAAVGTATDDEKEGTIEKGGARQRSFPVFELHVIAADRPQLLHCYLGLQALGGVPRAERLTMGGLLWRQARLLLRRHKRP